MEKLFTTEQVKRYFNILNRLNRGIGLGDKNYYPNSNCQRQVFVNRTIKKWFTGKYYTIIQDIPTGYFKKESNENWNDGEEIKIKAKMYIHIGYISYILGYGDKIEVSYTNATGFDGKSLEISHNDALRLQGEEITAEQFNKISDLFKVEQ